MLCKGHNWLLALNQNDIGFLQHFIPRVVLHDNIFPNNSLFMKRLSSTIILEESIWSCDQLRMKRISWNFHDNWLIAYDELLQQDLCWWTDQGLADLQILPRKMDRHTNSNVDYMLKGAWLYQYYPIGCLVSMTFCVLSPTGGNSEYDAYTIFNILKVSGYTFREETLAWLFCLPSKWGQNF